MPLPQLFPGFPQVDVQQTAFSVDALGRYVCSTWNEATLNGGPPFTTVVVGAGMYGAYCAAKTRAARPDRARAPARRGAVPRLGARAEPRQHRLQRARRYSAVQRSRRGARARLGHSVARQHRVPRLGVLHGRQVDLLGWLVPAADRR